MMACWKCLLLPTRCSIRVSIREHSLRAAKVGLNILAATFPLGTDCGPESARGASVQLVHCTVHFRAHLEARESSFVVVRWRPMLCCTAALCCLLLVLRARGANSEPQSVNRRLVRQGAASVGDEHETVVSCLFVSSHSSAHSSSFAPNSLSSGGAQATRPAAKRAGQVEPLQASR